MPRAVVCSRWIVLAVLWCSCASSRPEATVAPGDDAPSEAAAERAAERLEVAERFFAEGAMDLAAARYDALLESDAPDGIKAYAAYKRAWVHFNLAEYPQAVERLLLARELGPPNLQREVDKDLLRAWAHMPAHWPRVLEFYAAHYSAPEVVKWGYRLATMLSDMGRCDHALIVIGLVRGLGPIDGFDAPLARLEGQCRAVLGGP